MAWSVDTRIPIVLGRTGTSRDAALLPDGGAAPAGWAAVGTVGDVTRHAAGCGCCGGRSAVAVALDRLFQARVRGTVPWFDTVVADPSIAEAVVTALREDAVTAARFRLAGDRQ